MDGVLGLDIAKAKFDVALLWPDGRLRRKSCANTAAGFADLVGVAATAGRRARPCGAGSDGDLWARRGGIPV